MTGGSSAIHGGGTLHASVSDAAQAQPLTPRERHDPPLLRHEWTTQGELSREELLAQARARSGWDAARWESVLHHGGLQLGRRPHDAASLPASVPAGTRVTAWAFLREPEPVTLSERDLLHDAEGLVAVNKPAWLTMQATRASLRLSLEAQLRERMRCASLTALHRLDRETSGVALFARSAAAAARFGAAIRRGELAKRYLAWVSPPPSAARWEVRGFMARTLDPRRFRFALHGEPAPGRRASCTRFRRLASRGARALVLAQPETGRTHQIRVHLAAAGTPILGDPVYGASPASDRQGVPRLQLHAEELRLRLADAGTELVIHAPPPPDFLPAP